MPTKEELHKRYIYNPEDGTLVYRIKLGRRSKGSLVGKQHNQGHLCTTIDKKYASLHRIIYTMHFGQIPAGYHVDHIDGDKTNNRVSNLRAVPAVENMRNKPHQKNNTTGVMGVYYDQRYKRWYAKISIMGKLLHLGTFKDKKDAIEARSLAETQYSFHPNHGRVLQ